MTSEAIRMVPRFEAPAQDAPVDFPHVRDMIQKAFTEMMTARCSAELSVERLHAVERALARLERRGDAVPALMDGISALLGLIQLVLARPDVPSDIRKALESSHRIDEARAALAKALGEER